jgi:hypothetical protein
MHRLIRSVRSLLTFLMIGATAPAAYAAVPTSIAIQGKLTDASDNPLAGSQSVVFKVFDAAVGGVEIWPGGTGEMQTVTASAQGLFVALVGAVIPLNDAVFADTARWLQVAVGATTMPRVKLATGPFAYRVATVDGATGGAILGSLSVGNNLTLGNHSFAAGTFNSTVGWDCTIAGGQRNSAGDLASSIGGGQEDTVSGTWSFIGGGLRNVVSGEASCIGGGFANRSTGPHNTIAGGYQNVARTLAEKSAIGGGGFNLAIGSYTTIGGGLYDTASGAYSTVGGGNANNALSVGSTVSGGTQNLAFGARATVVGGESNYAKGLWSVAGGHGSRAMGWNSVAFGGGSDVADSNVASGDGSVVPGGARNRAAGNFSFAAGNRAKALHHGSFVWSDNGGTDFSTSANNQFLIRAGGGVGINTNTPEAPLQIGDADIAPSDGWMSLQASSTQGQQRKWQVGVFGGGTTSQQDGKYYSYSIDDLGLGSQPEFVVKWGTGNVGIGTIEPVQRLHVAGTGLYTARFENSHPTATVVEFQNTSSGAVWEYGVAGSSPPIGISAGSMYLYKQGTASFPFIISPTGFVSMNGGLGVNSGGLGIYGGGSLYISSNGFNVNGNSTHNGSIYNNSGCYVMWNCPSDLRLKKNIEPLRNSLQDVCALSAIRFDWRHDEFPSRQFSEDNQIGLIAQEVQKLVPQAVQEDRDGYLSVDYSRLVPLLVGSIKEQQELITDQQKRIKKLEEAVLRLQP